METPDPLTDEQKLHIKWFEGSIQMDFAAWGRAVPKQLFANNLGKPVYFVYIYIYINIPKIIKSSPKPPTFEGLHEIHKDIHKTILLEYTFFHSYSMAPNQSRSSLASPSRNRVNTSCSTASVISVVSATFSRLFA
jgi:hypothetical protein